MPPNFGGRIHSKSPRVGGFRGHSRIYVRGLVYATENPIGENSKKSVPRRKHPSAILYMKLIAAY